MSVVVRRAILPGLLITGGLASLIYGALFHSARVLEDHETQTTIEVPSEFPPPPMDGPSAGPPSFPDGTPFGGPPSFVKKTVTQIELVTAVESEPELTREITFGGVARLDSGELKRTYSGTKGPALCPS
jgi:hypothetical protein